jgi:hypothetical protein
MPGHGIAGVSKPVYAPEATLSGAGNTMAGDCRAKENKNPGGQPGGEWIGFLKRDQFTMARISSSDMIRYSSSPNLTSLPA